MQWSNAPRGLSQNRCLLVVCIHGGLYASFRLLLAASIAQSHECSGPSPHTVQGGERGSSLAGSVSPVSARGPSSWWFSRTAQPLCLCRPTRLSRRISHPQTHPAALLVLCVSAGAQLTLIGKAPLRDKRRTTIATPFNPQTPPHPQPAARYKYILQQSRHGATRRLVTTPPVARNSTSARHKFSKQHTQTLLSTLASLVGRSEVFAHAWSVERCSCWT
jgi:hypothetical protein